MIKAVFFDWFDTLAHYDPSREELQSQVLKEFGINLSPQEIIPGIFAADKLFFKENSVNPVRKRSPEEQAKVYASYQITLLTEAGVDMSAKPDLPHKIMARMQEVYPKMDFTLFEDVLPILHLLKERHLILGLLTNLDSDMEPICRKLGLDPYIGFTVTSGEVGADKPEAPIFQEALKRAGVEAAQTIHVGDQYSTDITGAMGVGINPILIDRNNLNTEVTDCPRIHSLPELSEYI